MLRKCKGKYYEYNKDIGRYKTINFELGYFHTWGNDYEEFETGAGNYSIAIVELPDGKIVKVNPSDLEFLDTKEYCEPILYISKENNKCNHKNLENIDGFIYCKDCGEIISISINKGE